MRKLITAIMTTLFVVLATMTTRAQVPTELWASIAYESSWDTLVNVFPSRYVSFTPQSPVTFTTLGSVRSTQMGSNGSALIDGHVYGMMADHSASGIGLLFSTLFEYDAETWELIKQTDITDYTLIATATAQAPDGTVYGQFYTRNLDGYTWGTVDYKNLRRTGNFGETKHYYLALGVTSTNELYGVALDGNLYRIGTSDGIETLVGATGISNLVNTSRAYGQMTGAIDQRTNTFYFVGCSAQTGASSLYTIDLGSGKATLVADLPNYTQLQGMIIPGLKASLDAPAAATGLQAQFTAPSRSGKLVFNAPSTTYGGSPLSGELTYTVKVKDQVVSTGTTTPGATTEAQIAEVPEGYDYLIVTLSNAAGESPKAHTGLYIGYDQPNAPTNVTLSISEDGHVNVGWQAPTTTVHGGYLGDLTYDVLQIVGSDTTTMASGLTGTSWNGTIELGQLTSYVYAVRAHNATQTSKLGVSPVQTMGIAYEPPYSEDFATESQFDQFTVIDGNHDGYTWNYAGYGNRCASYHTDVNGSDDWLISPAIHLRRGHQYNVSYQVWIGMSDYYTETMEVLYGTAATAEAMTDTIVAPTVYNNGDPMTVTNTIGITDNGLYHIGFHALSPHGMFLRVKNIKVEDAGTVDAITSVNSNKAQTFDVYTADGKAVSRHATSLRGAQPGLYILKSANGKSRKVIVR